MSITDWRVNKQITDYILHVEQRCRDTGVELRLVDNTFVGEGEIKCAGYFDSENLILAAATVDIQEPSRWVTLLAHEANHLEQWAEDCEIWKATAIGDYDAYVIWDMWLNNVIELNDSQLYDYTKRCLNVEKDCEIRTVETIKNWNLPFDIDEYTQRSNAYILQYQFCRKFRKWNIPGKAPSSLVEVYSKLSTKFDMDYYDYLPPDIEQLFMPSFFE